MLIKRTALLGWAGRLFLRVPVARIALRHVSQELVDLVLSQWGYISASGKDEVAQRDGPHLGRSQAACEVDRAVKLDEIVAGAGCTRQREESK